jgi:hypothetical protein
MLAARGLPPHQPRRRRQTLIQTHRWAHRLVRPNPSPHQEPLPLAPTPNLHPLPGGQPAPAVFRAGPFQSMRAFTGSPWARKDHFTGESGLWIATERMRRLAIAPVNTPGVQSKGQHH